MKLRIKFRKTSLLTKLLLLAVTIFAVTTLVSLQGQLNKKRAEVAALDEQVTVKLQEKLSLENDIAELNTPEGIAKVARERLGWVTDGEIVFYNADN